MDLYIIGFIIVCGKVRKHSLGNIISIFKFVNFWYYKLN